jgi:hypothetical protein
VIDGLFDREFGEREWYVFVHIARRIPEGERDCEWNSLMADLYGFCFEEIANPASDVLEMVYEILAVLVTKGGEIDLEQCFWASFGIFGGSTSRRLQIRVLSFLCLVVRIVHLSSGEAAALAELCTGLVDGPDSELSLGAWQCFIELLKWDGISKFAIQGTIVARAVEMLHGSFVEKCYGAQFLSTLVDMLSSRQMAEVPGEVVQVLAALSPELERVCALPAEGNDENHEVMPWC